MQNKQIQMFSLYKTGYSPNVIFPREDKKDRT